MSTWKGFDARSWTFGKSRIFGHGGGVGAYRLAYALDVSGEPMLNGMVTADIRLSDRHGTGAGLVCRADENWTFIAFYSAPDDGQEDSAYLRLAACREGLFIPIAKASEPVRLDRGDNRFSLEFFAGRVRGEVSSGEGTCAIEATCPHVPFPGRVGLVKFYAAVLQARDVEARKTDMPVARIAESAPEFEFDVFLCHSGKDKPLVNEIAARFKEAGVTYWLDSEQIDFGDPIVQKIEDGLRRSRYVLPCVSTNLPPSGWSRAEYSAVLNAELSGDDGRAVIPVFLDDIASTEIPALLRDKKRVTYANKVEFAEFLQFLRRQ